MIANLKNIVRLSSDAGRTSVGHIVNEYVISNRDDSLKIKKRCFFQNLLVRQLSDLQQLISFHLFFIFEDNYMENKYLNVLQPCCEVCGSPNLNNHCQIQIRSREV